MTTMMTGQYKVVLDGEVSLHLAIDGDISLRHAIDGEVGVITVIKDYELPIYDGDYVVTPKVVEQYLETDNRAMVDDVTILAIPFYETSNPAGGNTVFIANSLGD